ncbi:MAG TPA: hypothetical protein ENJ37_06105 [Deltaproteobacteria bacterium]|nr:hypothetical protein [Deltaproteobacteria bacterium]
MKRRASKFTFKVLPFTVILSIFAMSPVISGDGLAQPRGGDCRRCHAGPEARKRGLVDIYGRIASYRFPHTPVIQGNCTICHRVSTSPSRRFGAAAGGTKTIKGPGGLRRRYIPVAADKAGSTYRVDLTIEDERGRVIGKAGFDLDPRSVSSSLKDDGREPRATDVKVVGVKQAVFIESVIDWKTDKAATSYIEYGPRDAVVLERSPAPQVYSKEHRAVLKGLKAEVYRFRVVSTDIFGNRGVSKEYILDARKPRRLREKRNPGGGLEKPSLRAEDFVKVPATGLIHLLVRTRRPSRAVVRVSEAGAPAAGPGAAAGGHGATGSRSRYVQIDACLKCHSDGVSHPVAVRSDGRKTRIPPNLPTIEHGLLTCVTCHYPHGGDARHFSRLDKNRDLCVECHIGEPFM